MTPVQKMVQDRLEKALHKYLQPGVIMTVQASEDGVLERVCLSQGGSRFYIFGDDWTWEERR